MIHGPLIMAHCLFRPLPGFVEQLPALFIKDIVSPTAADSTHVGVADSYCSIVPLLLVSCCFA